MSPTALRWSCVNECHWKSGPFEVFAVDALSGKRVLYELCRKDEWLGDFDTREEAMSAAQANWDEVAS